MFRQPFSSSATRVLVFAFSSLSLCATQLSAEHLSEWSAPQNLGTVVNSQFNDQHPAVSPDNLALYFVSDRPGGAGSTDLWVTRRRSVHSPWQSPVPLPATINSAVAEFAPAFDRSGHLLFFGSDRPGGCGSRDIWVSYRKNTRDDAGWHPPVNLGCALNFSGFDDGPTLFEDKGGLVTMYFTSQNRPGGLGDFDVWSSVMNADGSFSPAANVSELNSPFRDTRTAIRRDGLEILFTSQRPGSQAGSLDLWVATRATTGSTWSPPVSVGPIVNSDFNDGAPALSRDARTLFFYSNRPGGTGANDLYVSTRARVHDSDGRDEERDDDDR